MRADLELPDVDGHRLLHVRRLPFRKGSTFNHSNICTGCSLNIVFFPLNFVIFLNTASSAAALVFYLPGVCTDTKGKQRKTRVQNILKSQNLMNTLYFLIINTICSEAGVVSSETIFLMDQKDMLAILCKKVRGRPLKK